MASALPALAASEPADTLPEVSVTAIKRQATLRYQPMAATVVDSAQLARFDIKGLKGLSEVAPNFYVPDYGSRMTSSIYVRGIGARMDQPSVALNVDNVPYLTKDAYDMDLPDIAGVEVLRGPQSTLYGRNAMMGVVNIRTLSPLQWQGLRATLQAGTGNSYRAALGLYAMPGRSWGMGLSGDFRYRGGWFTNAHTGRKADRERGGSVRWRTAARTAGGLAIDNAAAATFTRQDGYPYAYEATDRIDYNDTCRYRRATVTDGLTVRYTAGRVKLSSISSFQYLDDDMTLDQDFMPQSYFTLRQRRRERAVTQDLVASGTAGAYGWLGGVFGFYKNTHMDAPVTFKDDGVAELIEQHRNQANPDYPIRWDDRQFVLGSDFRTVTDGVALYHRSTLDAGMWNFALGLRLDMERASMRHHSRCNTGYTVLGPDGRPYSNVPVVIDDGGRLRQTFTQLLPSLTVTRRLDHSIIYATAAKGYKAGGFNNQMFSDVLQQRIMATMGLPMAYDVADIVSYRPEVSWNYEAGMHVTCDDGRVHAAVAAFYIDCRDQQLTVFPDGSGTGRIMTNAGKTRSCGAELSGNFAVGRWRLDVSYGYTNARFVRYDDGKHDYAHRRVPYAPMHTAFASACYSPVDGLSLDVNVRGVGDIYWDEANTARQPFYALLGATARYQSRGWSLELWGQNLTATHYRTFRYVSMSRGFYQKGLPARAGVTLKLDLALEP